MKLVQDSRENFRGTLENRESLAQRIFPRLRYVFREGERLSSPKLMWRLKIINFTSYYVQVQTIGWLLLLLSDLWDRAPKD